MKDSFIFYTEYEAVLDTLTAEQAGQLIRSMVKYAKGEDHTIADPVVRAVFAAIRPRMDRDAEKWAAEVEKRREAGRKGGMARASKAKQSQGVPSKAKECQTIQADNDSVSVTVTDNINPHTPLKRETQAKMLERLLTGRAVSAELADALRAWVAYKSQRRETYKEAGMTMLISETVNEAATYGPQAVIDGFNKAIAAQYKGPLWPSKTGAKRPASKWNNTPPRYESRQSMDDLERALLTS